MRVNRRAICRLFVATVMVFVLTWRWRGSKSSNLHTAPQLRQRVVALVFFGRKEYVSILHCYLKVWNIL